MKKLLLVLAIGSFAVACNNETASDATKAIDSTANAAKEATESAVKTADSTISAVADSATKVIDSLKK